MPDFNPALLRRMLLLRQYSWFSRGELDELASLAENVVATKFSAGTVIAAAGSRLSALQFVVDGAIETQFERIGPRQVFGALEVAASRPLSSTATATVATETFELSASDFDEVLEDNFGVMLSMLRVLATRMIAMPVQLMPKPAEAYGPLGLVERLILLRRLLPFAGVPVQALAMLAHESEEVRWPAGTVVMRAGDPPTFGLVIVDGIARCTRDGRTRDATIGAALGHLETLAQHELVEMVEAISPIRALRSPGSAMLDVLEDHPDVGMAMISAFSSSLLDVVPIADWAH